MIAGSITAQALKQRLGAGLGLVIIDGRQEGALAEALLWFPLRSVSKLTYGKARMSLLGDVITLVERE